MFDYSPHGDEGGGDGAVQSLTDDGLFIGQTTEFMELLHDLAADADAARRGDEDYLTRNAFCKRTPVLPRRLEASAPGAVPGTDRAHE